MKALAISAIWLGLRGIYYLLYIFIDDRPLSYLRTFVFYMALACPLMILFEAGHNIGDVSKNVNVGSQIPTI